LGSRNEIEEARPREGAGLRFEADKADTLSALLIDYFINFFNFLYSHCASERTGERGLESRRSDPTTSQAGHNYGKEPRRIVAAGTRVGNGGNR
jgi:hypothetical protein